MSCNFIQGVKPSPHASRDRPRQYSNSSRIFAEIACLASSFRRSFSVGCGGSASGNSGDSMRPEYPESPSACTIPVMSEQEPNRWEVHAKTVSEPAEHAKKEGIRRIDCGPATAEYDIAPLPDGRTAIKLTCALASNCSMKIP